MSDELLKIIDGGSFGGTEKSKNSLSGVDLFLSTHPLQLISLRTMSSNMTNFTVYGFTSGSAHFPITRHARTIERADRVVANLIARAVNFALISICGKIGKLDCLGTTHTKMRRYHDLKMCTDRVRLCDKTIFLKQN